MDAFLNKLERLADMASRRADPVPLDIHPVMARIHGLRIADEADYVPLGFFAGGAAAAAAAAVFITTLAITAWTELADPLRTPIGSFLDVMDAML